MRKTLIALNTLAVLLGLLLLDAYAVEHATIYVETKWLSPDGDSDWQPWMAGASVQVQTEVTTLNGQHYYQSDATIDYGSTVVSTVADITDLGDSQLVVVVTEIPFQFIQGIDTDGNVSVVSIQSQKKWALMRIGDLQYYQSFQCGQPMLNGDP